MQYNFINSTSIDCNSVMTASGKNMNFSENIEKKNLAKVSVKNPIDSSGTTPIHEAARFGKAEVFMFLMENIGDESVDQKDIYPRCNRAGTPLQIAEVMFPPEVIRKVKNKYFQLKRGTHSPFFQAAPA